MKIKYHNVGSIKDSEVEFTPGNLTLIRGETDQGKSLMFYSLADGLLNCSTFKSWINNKALKDNPNVFEQIIIIDDNSNEYKIKAGKSYLEYYYNNEKAEKPQRKTLFETLKKQIPGILFSPDELTPLLNIVQENEGFFPINRPDSQIYKTYERLLSLTSTQDIMRAIKLDLDDIQNQQKDKLYSLQKYKEQQTKITEFLSSNIDEKSIDNILNTLINYYNEYARISTLYNSILKDIKYVQAFQYLKNNTLEFFDTTKISKALALYTQYTQFNKSLEVIKNIKYNKEDYLDIRKVELLNNNYQQAYYKEAEIKELNNQIHDIETKLNSFEVILDSIEICPLCGQPIEGVEHGL